MFCEHVSNCCSILSHQRQVSRKKKWQQHPATTEMNVVWLFISDIMWFYGMPEGAGEKGRIRPFHQGKLLRGIKTHDYTKRRHEGGQNKVYVIFQRICWRVILIKNHWLNLCPTDYMYCRLIWEVDSMLMIISQYLLTVFIIDGTEIQKNRNAMRIEYCFILTPCHSFDCLVGRNCWSLGWRN